MTFNMKLELLAPAKNLECGIAAIHHGADAVYIGAPKFGAREAAGNSVPEIEKLADEARLFGVKTYVALNTILFDNELEEAERMIWQVYEAGADAIIIQDFGILEMSLPPIDLHASTQANNFTVGKLKFLEAVGFKRAVLARELSLDQISEISGQSSIELEAFVHGSLCVSLSGQCYMSHAMGGRSANRGACAQPCRKKYSLTDASGKVVVKDKHLLSLKDLDRSHSVGALVEAGIRSFKIEGRLKEIEYVKNITAYYRNALDRFLSEDPSFSQPSSGKTTFFFTPDPTKTFHRSSTEYFLHGRKEPVAGLDSPKSTGEELGVVTRIARDAFQVSGIKPIANNDGLTFLGRDGESRGLKVNKAENGFVFPDRMNGVYPGARISRNLDHTFQMAMGRKTSERKIPISVRLVETADGFEATAELLDSPDPAPGVTVGFHFRLPMEKVPANDREKSRENILKQLAKAGDTPFLVRDAETGGNEKYFFTSQQLNVLRRELLDLITRERRSLAIGRVCTTGSQLEGDQRENAVSKVVCNNYPYPVDSFHFEDNISNRLALQFFRRHGVEKPVMGIENGGERDRLQVMVTKHCLQHELGFCARFGGTFPANLTEPFILQDGSIRFELRFDCKNCLMRILLWPDLTTDS